MARLSLSFAALIMSASAVSEFTDTYQDCLEFAALFQNTCDSVMSSYSHVTNVPSVTQTSPVMSDNALVPIMLP